MNMQIPEEIQEEINTWTGKDSKVLYWTGKNLNEGHSFTVYSSQYQRLYFLYIFTINGNITCSVDREIRIDELESCQEAFGSRAHWKPNNELSLFS